MFFQCSVFCNLKCTHVQCIMYWVCFLFSFVSVQKGPHRCWDSGHLCKVRSGWWSGSDGAWTPANERRPGERESEWRCHLLLKVVKEKLKKEKTKNTAHAAFMWECPPSHSSCRCSVCVCSYARRTWIWNAIRWLDPTVGGASRAPRTTRRKTMTRTVATALDVAAAAQGASPTKSFKCMELLLFLF